jgi:hypothetical protein
MKAFRLRVSLLLVLFVNCFISCTEEPRVLVEEVDNKGKALGVSQPPEWLITYITSGISAVQEQYPGMYCFVGEYSEKIGDDSESSENSREDILIEADLNAQEALFSMLITNVNSANKTTTRESQGFSSETETVTVTRTRSFHIEGAQREDDWWIVRRHFDPERDGKYTDECNAYVLYTYPYELYEKLMADSLETNAEADQELYDITRQLAEDMLLEGFFD